MTRLEGQEPPKLRLVGSNPTRRASTFLERNNPMTTLLTLVALAVAAGLSYMCGLVKRDKVKDAQIGDLDDTNASLNDQLLQAGDTIGMQQVEIDRLKHDLALCRGE